VIAAASSTRSAREVARTHPIAALLFGGPGQRPDFKDATLGLPGALILAAVRTGNLPAVQWLLEHHPEDIRHVTLAMACRHDRAECLHALLPHCDELDYHLSAEDSGLIVKDEHEHNWEDYTALMVACATGSADCARLLLAEGASLDPGDWTDNSCLMISIIEGHVGLATELIPKSDTSYRNGSGWNALMLAAEKGYAQLVRALLRAGSENVDEMNNSGSTALIAAAENGHLRCVKLLIGAGADVLIEGQRDSLYYEKDYLNKTARMVALDNGHLQVAAVLAAAERRLSE
jgi:hypothetical protein